MSENYREKDTYNICVLRKRQFERTQNWNIPIYFRSDTKVKVNTSSENIFEKKKKMRVRVRINWILYPRKKINRFCEYE